MQLAKLAFRIITYYYIIHNIKQRYIICLWQMISLRRFHVLNKCSSFVNLTTGKQLVPCQGPHTVYIPQSYPSPRPIGMPDERSKRRICVVLTPDCGSFRWIRRHFQRKFLDQVTKTFIINIERVCVTVSTSLFGSTYMSLTIDCSADA